MMTDTGYNTPVTTSAQQLVIAVNNLNSTLSEFNSDIIPAARMPGLTGDVTAVAGTIATTIASGAVEQTMLATGVAVTGPSFLATGGVQTLNNATYTKLVVSSENWDSATCYDAATNYRFTPNVAGYYLVGGHVAFTSVVGSNNFCSIYVDGSAYKNSSQGALYRASATSMVYLNGSTNYVELYGYQGTGGAADTSDSSFWATLFRAA